ncbi:hypothetical protein LG296_20605 (plasmid) [Ureibacillus chungkukjangi]|uniref:hypothetical protein n=1 Tax=Ureibacillus chungkukjangi TaxID=1202712 RepID=UPI00200706BD|nr:hypothetical protein [Ureibacillus chungkukjangi]MCM3390442.1 hypothetical protein [Ureibacillus chungkukjangi]
MADFLDGIKLNAEMNYFIPSLLLLLLVPTIFAIIYAILFRRILPPKIFNFFIVPVVIIGFYVWAVPMEIGFHEYFRATF